MTAKETAAEVAKKTKEAEVAKKTKEAEKGHVKGKKTVNAVQAGTIFGLNSRYSLHLKKKYTSRLETIKSWALIFKEERLLEADSKFLV